MNRIRKLRLRVAFDGTGYAGWQIQKEQPTVQGTLASAIRTITGESVTLVGSGRTDAGTHARGLVASFSTCSRIAPAALVRALNSTLPPDIRVLSARRVSATFDARRSAQRKTYRYQIYCGKVMPPHLAREHFHYPYPIDLPRMQRACPVFVGEHDFAAFAAAGREKENVPKSTIRTIYRCDLTRRGLRLLLTVEGNGFLQHMVRNIAGTLLEVGRGRTNAEDIAALIQTGHRSGPRFTAPAHGLVLLKVTYRSRPASNTKPGIRNPGSGQSGATPGD